MESHERRREKSLREKLKGVVESVATQKDEHSVHQEMHPYVKAGIYIIGTFVVIWASQYAFSAVAGAMKQFKNMRRSFREK